jgi:hypothetical protein
MQIRLPTPVAFRPGSDPRRAGVIILICSGGRLIVLRRDVTWYYPQMEGWGGTVIALFPGKGTGVRIAKISEIVGGAVNATVGTALTRC